MKKLILAAMATMALTGTALAMEGAKHDGKGPHHDMFKEMDTNGDGSISREEATAHHAKKFDEMDADKDGKVTKSEAEAFHAKHMEAHQIKHDKNK